MRTEEAPQSTPGRRLQASRRDQRKGQRKLAQIVAEALRAPDRGLLHALNEAAKLSSRAPLRMRFVECDREVIASGTRQNAIARGFCLGVRLVRERSVARR